MRGGIPVVKRSVVLILCLAALLVAGRGVFSRKPSVPPGPVPGKSVVSTGSASWPHSKELGAYEVRIVSTGKVLCDVAWETTVLRKKGRLQVEILEKGQGQPWGYHEPVRWEKRMVLEDDPKGEADPPVQFRSVEESRWTAAGALLSRMDIQASPESGEILYKNLETGKSPESTVLPWTPQSLPDELLFYWARMLPFDQLQDAGTSPAAQPLEQEWMLLVSPSRQYRILAQLKGIEEVTTPAGTFSCYRVDLTPRLFGPLKNMAPKMALWCTAQAPHYWVRYRGPVGGGFGAPQAVMQLVKFERAAAGLEETAQ